MLSLVEHLGGASTKLVLHTSRTYSSPPLPAISTTRQLMRRSVKGTLIFSSDLTFTTMRSLLSRGSEHRPPSSNLTNSLPSTTASFLIYISSSLSLPLSQIMSHHPLRRIPAVTDFGSLISRSPAPTPPLISQQWIGKEQSSSSSRTNRTSGRPLPSSSPTKPTLAPQVSFLQRKLSRPLRPTMGLPRSFTSGGPRLRFGLPPPMPLPPMNKRWRLFTRTWRALMQAASHRFTLMSAWQQARGQPGPHYRQRSRPSFSQEITRSEQGPNSCVFIRGPANKLMTSWPSSRP